MTLRSQAWRLIPGTIASVRPRKEWSYAGHPYLSGDLEGSRVDVEALDLALLATGFLPDARTRREQAELLAQLMHRFRDVRRSGSAAIDLCLIASGALDLYYEFGLGHWDITGGAAIAEAAGATVLELEPTSLPAPLIVAGNALLVETLTAMLVEAGAVAAR